MSAADTSQMKRELCRLADEARVDLVFTSGSVGIAAHDIAGQATSEVVDFQVPGIAETMRAHSIARNPMRMLARYVAGVRGATMIVTLPGAPDDLTDMLEMLKPVLPGAVEDLRTRGGRRASLSRGARLPRVQLQDRPLLGNRKETGTGNSGASAATGGRFDERAV